MFRTGRLNLTITILIFKPLKAEELSHYYILNHESLLQTEDIFCC